MPVTHEGLRHRQPEAEHKSSHFAGLHARLILADPKFLNPNEKSPALTPENVVSLDDRNYQPYDNVSRFERKKYWKQNAGFDENFERWKNGVTSHLNSLSTEEHDGYIPLLRNIGITIEDEDNNEYTKRHAEQIYNRYFPEKDTENSDKGIKLFIIDTIYAYTQFEKNSETGEIKGRFDSEKLNEHLPQLSEFATIFGHGSKEMIQHLLQAEIDLMNNPQKLVHASGDPAGMRINKLNDDEKNILEFIHRAQTDEDEKSDEGLPILRHKEEIKNAVRENEFTVLIGGTGSGKTVGTPNMIREVMQEQGDKHLIITEPTQINTQSLAESIAKFSDPPAIVGKEIDFRHGNKRKYADEADTLIMTEGTLVNRLLEDPMLLGGKRDSQNNLQKKVDYVMVDEVHVRSIHTELELALLKKANELRRKQDIDPIHILMASATVDQERLKEYAGVSDIINVKGKMYEINDNHYLGHDIPQNQWLDQMPAKAADTVLEILEEKKKGDMIIFAPKTVFLNKIEEEIKKRLEDIESDEQIRIIQLHRFAPEENKKEAENFPEEGVRRIFVGTNFAETGLTINGLKFVINTGLENEKSLDLASGLESLNIVEKSNAALMQCNGRVGRTDTGDVYYLFSEKNRKQRMEIKEKQFPTPEIQRSDLTELLLDMKYRDYDLKELDFFTPKDEFKNNLAFAEETLRLLGAVDKHGNINDIGRRMVDFGRVEMDLNYHFSRMLAEAEKRGHGFDQIATIIALSKEKQLVENWQKVNERFGSATSDFQTLLHIWKEFEKNKPSPDAWRDMGINFSALKEARKTRKNLIHQAQSGHEATNEDELGQIITTGLADRVFTHQPGLSGTLRVPKGRNRQPYMTGGTNDRYVIKRKSGCSYDIAIDRNSVIKDKKPKLFVALNDNTTILNNGNKRIFTSLTQEIKPEWLPQEAA